MKEDSFSYHKGQRINLLQGTLVLADLSMGSRRKTISHIGGWEGHWAMIQRLNHGEYLFSSLER